MTKREILRRAFELGAMSRTELLAIVKSMGAPNYVLLHWPSHDLRFEILSKEFPDDVA